MKHQAPNTKHQKSNKADKSAGRRVIEVWCFGILWCLVFGFWCLPAVAASHPRLLLDNAGIVQLKQRITNAPWAKAEWQQLVSKEEKELDEPIVLPPRGGNWSHHYVCPTHGARLQTGKKLGSWQWEHICPVGKHVLKGDPSSAATDFDGVAIADIHENYATEVIDHGLVFEVTGDERHARKAREILLAYADRYLTYPLHDNDGKPGKGGHVASQSLTEARWLIDLLQGADLIWSTLNDADRHLIADKIIMPALNDVILPSNLGIHNIQCRLNSAIGLAGFLLDNQTLITRAVDGPVGYRAQLEQGVLGDGMWIEGSSGYHFFTIAGLWPLAEAARNSGVDLYTPKFKSMFDGPLKLAMPNLTLPNFNDSGAVSLQSEADSYELAFARFHDPAYVPLIEKSSRRGRLALLFGETQLPAGSKTELGSHNSTASGYAILQQGTDSDATWLCLKYGAHGGGHGHPDKNHFILYAGGQILAPDAGVHAYGSPLHGGWDKTTLAHNTLVVDEISQAPATGKCIAFGRERGVDYVITDAGPIYPGVRFIRAAAMLTPNLLVFVDQIDADAPHTFDLAYHQIGEWQDLPDGTAWTPPSGAGYKYLTQTTVRTNGSDAMVLKTKIPDAGRASITIASGEPCEIITGYGALKTTEDLCPIVIQRRHAQRAVFVWAITTDGSAISLQLSPVHDSEDNRPAGNDVTCVQVETSKRQWTLLVNPQKHDVLASISEQLNWRTTKAFGARPGMEQ
jgi:hypothetical protein